MIRNNKLKDNIKKNSVLLVRHGQSIWNHDSKFTGWTNIPLTDVGREEAKTIAETLKHNNTIPNVVFSSVLNRCIETSNIIKNNLYNKDIETYTSWRLNEKHYGNLEGVPRKYIRNQYGDKFTTMMRNNFYMKPPVINIPDIENIKSNEYSAFKNCYFDKIKNGESKENVLQRLLPYYENDILYTLSENKLPLIVTHKHCARVLMKHLLNINDDDFEDYKLPEKNIIHIFLDDDLKYVKHENISY